MTRTRLQNISRAALVPIVVSAAAVKLCGNEPSHEPSGTESPRLRRPVAAALLDEGRTLCIANRRSGTVSLVDVEGATVRSELPVGRRLSDLAVLPEGRYVLATDEDRHELIVLNYESGRLQVRQRLAVSRHPVSIAVDDDGASCSVASLWSRRLSLIDLSPLSSGEQTEKPRVIRTVRLPFPPRKQLWLPKQQKVVVADAFGGKLAVVDPETAEIVAQREVPGHNIRGLALSADGKQLYFSHQFLNRLAHSSLDDVHWGNLIENVVRSIRIDRLLQPGSDLFAGGRLIHIGTVGNGAADPGGIAVDEASLLVALSGVHELGVMSLDNGADGRYSAGRRPTDVVLDEKRRRVFTVNTLSDSISVFELTRPNDPAQIPLGPMSELGPAERGQLLFYDGRVSHDGWMSCHSCHTDGHSNGRLADTLGDGSYGAPKRVPSLLGVRDTDLWAWNGSMKELQDQVHKSVQTTMHGKPLSDRQANDLVAFLHTLSPPPPVDASPTAERQARIERGRRLFDRNGCSGCHMPFTYTTPGTYDVGLVDEAGNKKFNPPSLRGVGQRSAFFHDNRARTLKDVFTEHGHQLQRGLSDDELADLIAFLQSL